MKLYFKGQSLSGGSGGTSEEVYSTEETRIGTWIDGKPLYRRVFTVKSPTVENSEKDILADVETQNIQSISHCYGWLKSGANTWIPWNVYFAANAAISTYIQVNSERLNALMKITGVAYLNKTVIFIAEYTKTTD